MKYLCKFYEDDFLVIDDNQEIPPEYTEISQVDYMASSMAYIKYYYNDESDTTIKVRTFSECAEYDMSEFWVDATEEQINQHNTEFPDDPGVFIGGVY